MSLTTDKHDRTGSGQVFAFDDSGPYIRLEMEARTQKLTALEQSKDVDACLQTLDVEIAKIGRNVFKEYCDIRVSPPDEFFFPCASVMLLCGEQAISWNALKKLLQDNSYSIIKEKIREFRLESVTMEKYEHVNDFVRRHWEHLNFKKVSSVCESLGPMSEWVKFQLKKYDLQETLRKNEDSRRSRKSMGARASLVRCLSSINNFTVSDQLAGLSLDEPNEEKTSPASFPPMALRHTTMPISIGVSTCDDSAPAPLTRPGSFGGLVDNIRRDGRRSQSRRASGILAKVGNQRAPGRSAGHLQGGGDVGRSKKFMSYGRVPATILEGVVASSEGNVTGSGTVANSKPNAAAVAPSIEATERRENKANKSKSGRRSSNYLSMYTQ